MIMARLWPHGERITVEANSQGELYSFTWRGECHPIQAISNVWRVDETWWQKHILRDYFKLTTQTGLLVVIYQDLLSNFWYLERLFD